jgi:hypothetical protein
MQANKTDVQDQLLAAVIVEEFLTQKYKSFQIYVPKKRSQAQVDFRCRPWLLFNAELLKLS